jgi:hypothetical protein
LHHFNNIAFDFVDFSASALTSLSIRSNTNFNCSEISLLEAGVYNYQQTRGSLCSTRKWNWF